MLELGTDDALRRRPKTIPVKPERPLQIIHTQGNDRNAWLHASHPFARNESGYYRKKTKELASDDASPCRQLWIRIAERVGFEPTVATRTTTVFETVPFNRSGTSPGWHEALDT